MADETTNDATLGDEEFELRRDADGNNVYAKKGSEKLPAEDKREKLLSASPADQRKLSAPPHTKPLTESVEKLINTPTNENNEGIDLEAHRGGSLINDTVPGTPLAQVAVHETPELGKHLEVPVPVEHEDVPATNRRALDEGEIEAADLGPYPGLDTTEYNESMEARRQAENEGEDLPEIKAAKLGERAEDDDVEPTAFGDNTTHSNDTDLQPWIEPAEPDAEATALAEGRASVTGSTTVDNTLTTDRQTYEPKTAGESEDEATPAEDEGGEASTEEANPTPDNTGNDEEVTDDGIQVPTSGDDGRPEDTGNTES